ncbi:MAG: DUF3750 domain-containing protein [Myxococcales bacterium]|nr:DUF3750 domain-containing protein [Myxococcales bacterium]
MASVARSRPSPGTRGSRCGRPAPPSGRSGRCAAAAPRTTRSITRRTSSRSSTGSGAAPRPRPRSRVWPARRRRGWPPCDYRGWPGPNSNTFGDVMLRRCGLHASLPATAIGKDWRGWVGASWTTEGTGFQIEAAGFGLRLGLREGVEVHVLGLAFGVELWPPALIVPLAGGRLGFADR